MARSSLLSSIVLILAVFIVIMFAVTDIENTALRKPFSPNIFNEADQSPNQLAVKNSPETSSNANTNNLNTLDANSTTSTNTSQHDPQIIYAGEGNPTYPIILKNSQEELNYDLNFENLKKAGLTSLLIQRKPFQGILFNDFKVPELSALEVNQQSILSKISEGSLQTTIMETWEFKSEDSPMAKEIYDLLRTKLAGSLGIVVNETNQFGQQSFYVNFDGEDQHVFLVVKQYNSVYALSYLKGYHDLIKALFKLI